MKLAENYFFQQDELYVATPENGGMVMDKNMTCDYASLPALDISSVVKVSAIEVGTWIRVKQNSSQCLPVSKMAQGIGEKQAVVDAMSEERHLAGQNMRTAEKLVKDAEGI